MMFTGIKILRIKLGYTTTEFAKILGVTNGRITQWENEGNIPLKRIEEISIRFNVPAWYLTTNIFDLNIIKVPVLFETEYNIKEDIISTLINENAKLKYANQCYKTIVESVRNINV